VIHLPSLVFVLAAIIDCFKNCFISYSVCCDDDDDDNDDDNNDSDEKKKKKKNNNNNDNNNNNSNKKTWQLRMHCNLRPPEPRQSFSSFNYDAVASLKLLNQ